MKDHQKIEITSRGKENQSRVEEILSQLRSNPHIGTGPDEEWPQDLFSLHQRKTAGWKPRRLNS